MDNGKTVVIKFYDGTKEFFPNVDNYKLSDDNNLLTLIINRRNHFFNMTYVVYVATLADINAQAE